MISKLNKDLKPFEDLMINFSKNVLKPSVAEHDTYPYGKFDFDVIEELFQKIYELGFLGIMLPEKYGGIEQGISALCMMLGCIAEIDASYSLIILTSSLSQAIIVAADDDKTARKIFPNAKNARDYLISFPSFNNPGQINTLPQATLSGNKYKLTGKLDYLVLGNFSKYAVIPAKLTGKPGYSFFLIDLTDNDIKKSDPVVSLGLHACPIVDIVMEGTNAELIGKEGEGEKYFNMSYSNFIVASAAVSAGLMKGSINEALDYTKERKQGGRLIINWSEMRMILSNMVIRSRAADMCVAQTCKAMEDKIQDWGIYSTSTALLVNEMCCEVVTDGVQVLGGYGYMKDFGQEKRYRDARMVQALLGSVHLKKLALADEISL